MYEGAPNYPDEARFWKLVEDYRVSILYTAPTAIRAFMKRGEQFPKRHDLSSLRLLGTVGEPINPEAWMWYHEVIGGGRCPIVDTWWQTETGAIMISSLPGAMPGRPGSASQPLPGVFPMVVDKGGNPVPPGKGGFLVITQALAVDAPHHLRRRQAVQPAILEGRSRLLFHGRRRAMRRGGKLLDPGPGRRRDQRLRPPAFDHGGRERRG